MKYRNESHNVESLLRDAQRRGLIRRWQGRADGRYTVRLTNGNEFDLSMPQVSGFAWGLGVAATEYHQQGKLTMNDLWPKHVTPPATRHVEKELD